MLLLFLSFWCLLLAFVSNLFVLFLGWGKSKNMKFGGSGGREELEETGGGDM